MKALISGTSRLKSQEYPIYLVAQLMGEAAQKGYQIKELHACGGKVLTVAAKSYTSESPERPSFHHHPAHQEESLLPSLDLLLTIWDGKSINTSHLIQKAKSLNIPVITIAP